MIFRYYFVREDKINTRRVTKRKTKIWINNDSTWSIVKHRKLVLVWCSLHIKIKLMDQIKRLKKNPLRSYPTNTQQTMSWEVRPWHVSYRGQMFDVLSGGSNVRRIVRAKRNMKIANSSQIKIFFHRFFYSYSLIYLFLSKEWRRKYAILCKQLQTITSYTLKALREEEYLFSDGSKREVKMAGYWQSSFLCVLRSLASCQFIKTQENNEAAIMTEQA